jgi:hypothetical protein
MTSEPVEPQGGDEQSSSPKHVEEPDTAAAPVRVADLRERDRVALSLLLVPDPSQR